MAFEPVWPGPPPSPDVPAGWRPDPYGNGQRWWDGRSWTTHHAPSHGQGAGLNGFAVASLITALTLIGAPLAVVFGLVALHQIRRAGGAERGRGLALAGTILGVAWLALGTVTAVATGFDLSEQRNAKDFAREGPEIRVIARTVDEFEQALDDEAVEHVCRDLLTAELAMASAQSSGGTCESSWLADVRGRRQADLYVSEITVRGVSATAIVIEAGKRLNVSFTFEGGRWRIAAIEEQGNPTDRW